MVAHSVIPLLVDRHILRGEGPYFVDPFAEEGQEDSFAIDPSGIVWKRCQRS